MIVIKQETSGIGVSDQIDRGLGIHPPVPPLLPHFLKPPVDACCWLLIHFPQFEHWVGSLLTIMLWCIN